jgi:hypothetical protein
MGFIPLSYCDGVSGSGQSRMPGRKGESAVNVHAWGGRRPVAVCGIAPKLTFNVTKSDIPTTQLRNTLSLGLRLPEQPLQSTTRVYKIP